MTALRQTSTAARRLHRGMASKVGVVGLGLMGHGIAQVSAEKGFDVVAVELEERFLDSGMTRIQQSVGKIAAKAVAKGKMDQASADAHVASALGRITPTTDLGALASCDVIVEAVIEDLSLKQKLYTDIGKLVHSECVIASNTSSLSIGAMAPFTGRPKQMVGLHFFNPVQLMQLVEVVKTEDTDSAVFDRAMQYAKDLGKTPIECIDTPGFVVNRLLIPYLCEALLMYERGVASAADIDTAMRLGASHPMGPIALADYVGLDTTYNIIKGWDKQFPGQFKVPASLAAKVAEGKLGRKTGEGYHKWVGDKLA